MLTVEKLRNIANEALENNEWICMASGEMFSIFKVEDQEDVDELLGIMEDGSLDDIPVIYDITEDSIYTDADHAQDWNYFKNTMGI